jgi:hypothetical protein
MQRQYASPPMQRQGQRGKGRQQQQVAMPYVKATPQRRPAVKTVPQRQQQMVARKVRRLFT